MLKERNGKIDMKKILMIVLAFLTMNTCTVSAESTVDDIQIKDGKVIINGTADKELTRVGVVVIPSDAQKSVENITAIGETVSGEDGKFTISFQTEGEGTLWSDNDCTVYIRVNGAESTDETFYYYSVNGKNSEISDFINVEADRTVMLGENDAGYKTFKEIGIRVDALTAEQMPELITMVSGGLTSGMSEESFVAAMNKGVLAVLIKESGTEETVKELMSAVFDGFGELEEDKKNWLSTALIKNGPYSNEGIMDNAYLKVQTLYSINYAQHSGLRDLIINNKAMLGIENENTFKSFSNLTLLESGAVCEKLAELLLSRTAYTSQILMSHLTTALLSSSDYSGGANGDNSDEHISAGGGGGSGSYEELATVTTTQPTDIGLGAEDAAFDDLASASWAMEAINALYSKKIINGIGERKFEPNRPVTREEFLTMLVKAAGLKASEISIDFRDVPIGAWYYDVINVAYVNGITEGIGDGLFGTGRKITREDMAVMVYRVFDKKILNKNIVVQFTDFDDISGYAKESVKQLCEAGVVSGMPDGSFAPKGDTTRAQAAAILHRVLGE